MNARVLIVAGGLLAGLSAAGMSQGMQNGEVSCYKRMSTYSSQYLSTAARNLRVSLTSKNEGVVESSIMLSTLMRVGDPSLDLGDTRSALHDLAVSGKTASLRYKAFLATIVFDDPKSFTGVLDVGGDDGDQFFSYVSAQVSRSLLGYKGE